MSISVQLCYSLHTKNGLANYAGISFSTYFCVCEKRNYFTKVSVFFCNK